MNHMYLFSVTKGVEKYPLHDEAQRTGGFVVSGTQFVVREVGLDPDQVITKVNEEYGVEVIVERLTQELVASFSGTGLQEHIEYHWS